MKIHFENKNLINNSLVGLIRLIKINVINQFPFSFRSIKFKNDRLHNLT